MAALLLIIKTPFFGIENLQDEMYLSGVAANQNCNFSHNSSCLLHAQREVSDKMNVKTVCKQGENILKLHQKSIPYLHIRTFIACFSTKFR